MTQENPEYHKHEEFQLRSQKLADIRKLGVEPYPHKFCPTTTAKELQTKYATTTTGHSEDAATGKTEAVTVAGRLVLFRSMGKMLLVISKMQQVVYRSCLTKKQQKFPDIQLQKELILKLSLQ